MGVPLCICQIVLIGLSSAFWLMDCSNWCPCTFCSVFMVTEASWVNKGINTETGSALHQCYTVGNLQHLPQRF